MFLYLLSTLATKVKVVDVGRIEEGEIDLMQFFCDTQVENNPKYQLATDDISNIEAEMKNKFQAELEKRNLVCEKQEGGFLFKITIEEDYDPIKTYNYLQDSYVANNDGMTSIQTISCNVYKEKYMKICRDLVSAIEVLHSYCEYARIKANSYSEQEKVKYYDHMILYNDTNIAINFFLYCRKDIKTKGILLYPTSIDVTRHGEYELTIFYENKIIEDVDFSSFGDLKDLIDEKVDEPKYIENNYFINDYIKSKTKQQSFNVELRKNVEKAFGLTQKYINANSKFECAHLRQFSCNQTNIKLYDITKEDKKNMAALGYIDKESMRELNTTLRLNNNTIDHVSLPDINYFKRYKTLCTNYAELHLFCQKIITIKYYFKKAAWRIIEYKTMEEYIQTDIVNIYNNSLLITVIEEYKNDAKKVIKEIQEKINTCIKEYNEKSMIYEDLDKELVVIQKPEFEHVDKYYNATNHIRNILGTKRNIIERNKIHKKQRLVKATKLLEKQNEKMQNINNFYQHLIRKNTYKSNVEQYNKMLNEIKKPNIKSKLEYNTEKQIRKPIKYITSNLNILVDYIDYMKEVAVNIIESSIE
ncbi:hypothetical protein BDAP_001103 [Binucleata daphniae]